MDTIADLAVATNISLKVYGYPTHSDEAIRSFVGNGISKLLERALPEDKRTPENVAKLLTHFTAHYDLHNADLSTPYPGVAYMLHHLQCKGVKLAVASNKYQTATEKLVAHYFPQIHFECVFGQRTDIPIKPNPQIVEEIMSRAKVDSADVLYVGDSGVDMQTAKNAGVDAVAVSWGFRPRPELEAFHPLAIIDRAEELEKWVL